MTRDFYNHGKLLITGEYVVLDGAQALAVPTLFGQSLHVTSIDQPLIRWKSKDHEDKTWFQGDFLVSGNSIILRVGQPSSPVAERLQNVLSEANKLNPGFLHQAKGFEIITKLEFPSSCGLGSSSTLLNNIALLFDIDPYKLLERTFGGSGYDIAAARNDAPIIYQLTGEERSVLNTSFNPGFSENLFFVHL